MPACPLLARPDPPGPAAVSDCGRGEGALGDAQRSGLAQQQSWLTRWLVQVVDHVSQREWVIDVTPKSVKAGEDDNAILPNGR